VHPYLTAGLHDAGADFQQPEPESICLGAGQFRPLQRFTQVPDQTAGKGVQQEPELIGRG